MTKQGLIVVTFAIITLYVNAAFAAVAAEPVIKKQGSQWTIELPEGLQKAIRAFNPDFWPWEMKDFAPRIRDSYKESDPKESPFALIVDANLDNRPDVIIDGHDKKRDLLIGVVSDKERYKVHIIRENTLSDPRTLENWNEGKKETGLNYYLWLNKSGTDAKNKSLIFKVGYPQVEFEDGTATDGAIVDYLYENGEFKEQVNEL